MRNLFVAIFIMVAGLSYAQSSNQDVAVIQATFGKEKQELVKAYMNLNEEQSTKFWPVYEAYESERQALVRERLQNMSDYVQKYGALTDESAEKIVNSLLDNDDKLVKLEKKYLSKMAKATSGTIASSFFQLETYLRNLIFSEIQEQVPSIQDLK